MVVVYKDGEKFWCNLASNNKLYFVNDKDYYR